MDRRRFLAGLLGSTAFARARASLPLELEAPGFYATTAPSLAALLSGNALAAIMATIDQADVPVEGRLIWLNGFEFKS